MKRSIFSIIFVYLLIFGAAQGQLTYNNPLLGGFYPDPSICRVGEDYYLVNSSFEYFPGLPIMHSKDLVNWEQIGNAMNRNAQFSLAGGRVSRGLFAPTIRFHDGVFYIICTNVTKGGNFIITSTDPKGPWSDPIYLPEVNGIDPSLFFDDNGKAYITYNSIPPDDQPLYNGHRTIRLIEYDFRQKKTTGKNRIIVNGGSDISRHPVWIEGPHLYKIKGLYYLMCAEGGTAEDHSEVIFR
ncbi:MAG TPA: glycoside hydrolase family 43 protein, partial [Arachidicoccus sp.]|nr:glycoside hydrolase family 43 protein [Arachidicoccus sp.]